MQKRSLKKFIIIAIILCTVWTCYKVFLLYYYKPNDHSYIKEQLESAQNTTITSDKSLANTKFLDMNLFISDEYKEYKPQGLKKTMAKVIIKRCTHLIMKHLIFGYKKCPKL